MLFWAMTRVEYPQDFFVNIENDDYRMGRITLNLHGQTFTVEIDIVQKESRKIWHHVDTLYKIEDRDHALQEAVQRLSQFLQGHG